MAQTITDFNTFLQDAKETVSELTDFEKKEEELRQEENRLERFLESEKKAVADGIALTVKRRREEISSSYDNEINKAQDKLKKIRSKREKAKNQGVKERIQEETTELHTHNRELKVRMKTLFQKEHVPGMCSSSFYYSLYFPHSFKEYLTLLLTIAVCFLVVPYGLYMMLPDKKTMFLVGIYFVCILVFGGIYTLVGNKTRGRHLEALKEGRAIRTEIMSNNRKIKIISSSIRKDGNDAVYNLEKYDDEIAQIEQDLDAIAGKKKDALSTFENVTKTIISDEITGNSKEKMDNLTSELEEVSGRRRYTETMVKEKRLYITDTYESYVGKEFLHADRLEELRMILQTGDAANISEAIEVYRNRAKK